MYEQKSNDFEAIIRTIENTSYEEMRTYIEILEKENIDLASQVENFNNIRNSYSEPYSQMFQNSNPKNILSHHRGSSGSGKLYTEGEEL